MKRLVEVMTDVFLLLIAAVSASWLWAGWEVEIDGATLQTGIPVFLLIVSLLLAAGMIITNWTAGPVEQATDRESNRDIGRRPSLKFSVKQGKRYKAQISLGFFEQVADNAMIAGMFQKAGFADVTVTGIGAIRHAEGRWAGADATAEMPSQIVSATEIAETQPQQPSAGTPA